MIKYGLDTWFTALVSLTQGYMSSQAAGVGLVTTQEEHAFKLHAIQLIRNYVYRLSS
jgi:hypothetical protein